LLRDAASAAEAILGSDAEVIRILRGMPPLTTTIVYSSDKWNRDVVPRYQAAYDALSAQANGPEVELLREMLLKVKDLFFLEVQNPRQDFYMCLLDEMRNKYSNGKTLVAKAPQESLCMMHAIDMVVHQKKTDVRRDTAAGFFMRLYEASVAGHTHWEMDSILAEHGHPNEQRALSSVTPLLSFEVEAEKAVHPTYVLMEGNGRLAALNAAIDVVRAKYPAFVAPHLTITLVPFDGPPRARRNLVFLLELTWRCTFPDVDIPGWKPQVTGSTRPIQREIVESMPRYFGYTPVRGGVQTLPALKLPTRCKAITVAGG